MAKDDMNLILSSEGSEDTYIQVPIKKVDFGDFITNLLGQPETIATSMSGPFVATHEWLVHVHHLLEQRIKLQANSNLVDFTATIAYENAPSRRITTANGFVHFSETLTASTKSIVIAWTYLVFFPNKTTPEKQEITLHLSTTHTSTVDLEAAFIPKVVTSDGFIVLTVAHTERTWGDDITALLTREIETIIRAKSIADRCKEYFKAALAISFFLVGLFLPEIIDQLLREKQTASLVLNFYPANGAIESLSTDEKLNLILKLLNPENQLTQVNAFYKAASFIIGASLAMLSLIWFDSPLRSYILMTKKDYKDKTEFEEKVKSKFRTKVISFLLAVTAGVAGNLAYYILHLPSN